MSEARGDTSRKQTSYTPLGSAIWLQSLWCVSKAQAATALPPSRTQDTLPTCWHTRFMRYLIPTHTAAVESGTPYPWRWTSLRVCQQLQTSRVDTFPTSLEVAYLLGRPVDCHPTCTVGVVPALELAHSSVLDPSKPLKIGSTNCAIGGYYSGQRSLGRSLRWWLCRWFHCWWFHCRWFHCTCATNLVSNMLAAAHDLHRTH